jgi:hypothetical protein
MSDKHGKPTHPPKPKPKDDAPAAGREHSVSPYLRRPLRRLDEVERRPDTGDRPDNARKPRQEGDGTNE